MNIRSRVLAVGRALRSKAHLILPVLGILLATLPLMATPFAGAAGEAAGDIQSMAKTAGPVLGVVCLIIGGCIAAYKAVKGEPSWTTNLIFAIVGVAISAVV